MEAYSKEFRAEVLAARDAGESTHAVALRFKVSKAWVRRIVQQRRETGQLAAKTTRKRAPKWRAWADWLLAKLNERPDVYLRELRVELKRELGEEASLTTLCAACRELKRTRKKRRLSPPSRIASTSPNAASNGVRRKANSTRIESFSSTKRGPKRT